MTVAHPPMRGWATVIWVVLAGGGLLPWEFPFLHESVVEDFLNLRVQGAKVIIGPPAHCVMHLRR